MTVPRRRVHDNTGGVRDRTRHSSSTAGLRASPARTSSATRCPHLTLAPSLKGYRREWLAPDLLAAATLLVIAVPEQLATSRLAGMPPITGLYAFIAGSLVFALLGTSPQISVGADSTIAPLFAAGLGVFAATGSARYVDLVGILAVMAGVAVAAVWLLRLGWIAELLSAPIITGFLAGIGIVIIVHQLPDLLGVAGGGSSTLGRLKHVADELHGTCAWTVVIGSGVFATGGRSPSVSAGACPAALVALVAATALVAIFGLQHHGVAILGHVAHGAPHLGLHGLSLHALGQVAPVAAIVALVDRHPVGGDRARFRAAIRAASRRAADIGRDLLAIGVGNIAGRAGRRIPGQRQPAAHRRCRAGRRAHAARRAARGARDGRADPGRRRAPLRAGRGARRACCCSSRRGIIRVRRTARDRALRQRSSSRSRWSR